MSTVRRNCISSFVPKLIVCLASTAPLCDAALARDTWLVRRPPALGAGPALVIDCLVYRVAGGFVYFYQVKNVGPGPVRYILGVEEAHPGDHHEGPIAGFAAPGLDAAGLPIVVNPPALAAHNYVCSQKFVGGGGALAAGATHTFAFCDPHGPAFVDWSVDWKFGAGAEGHGVVARVRAPALPGQGGEGNDGIPPSEGPPEPSQGQAQEIPGDSQEGDNQDDQDYEDTEDGFLLLTEMQGQCVARVPTVSEWGLIVMTLLLLTAGTVVLGRMHRPAPA